MIHQALGRPVPVELSDDRRVRARVIRLAATSVVALGIVLALAMASLSVPPFVVVLLGLGWILMPTFLLWSLADARARYLLVVPSSLVTMALLLVCVGWLPGPPVAAAGWLLVTAGVGLGGLLGLWFWYRLAPVPRSLDDPYAPGRWALIGLHVSLVSLGGLLAATALP